MSNEFDDGTFQRLLDSMPDIADAVNKFSSEENQHTALRALIDSLVGNTVSAAPVSSAAQALAPTGDDPAAPSSPTPDDAASAVPAPKAKRSPRKLAKGRVEPIRDLDFWPDGKQSLHEFTAQKQPTTIDQRNIVAVYYLEQILQIPGISTAHVLAVYSECDWREPSYPDNALQVTASRERWIDTKDMQNIVTTPSGRNKIREMPIAKKTKK